MRGNGWLLIVTSCALACAGDGSGGAETSGSTDGTSGSIGGSATASSGSSSGSPPSTSESATTGSTAASTGGSTDSDGASGSETTAGPSSGELIGWASVSGDGVPTTTGGEGGKTVQVDNIDDLVMYAEATEPYVIQLSGTIAGEVRPVSNKTLEGLPGAVLIGSIVISGDPGDQISNVIVRNLTIRMENCPGDGCSSDDTVRIYQAHHVWIDHCDISDGDDGSLDITQESDYVTVSWNVFSYSSDAGSHRLSNLIGADDASTEDADDLGVTLHHNWWTDNVTERMPRVRFGPVHVFNNYYSPADDLYCVRPGFEANVLVENNYFDGANEPFDTPEPTARILATGNAFDGSPTTEPMQGEVFEPPYEYTLDDAEDVPAIVQAGAGPS